MTTTPVIQAERPDPGSHVGHITVPTEARQMASGIVAHAQRIQRAQGMSATLAELEAAKVSASQLIQCGRAMEVSLARQIAAAKGKPTR